jgi:serine/threonine-protein kinase RsbW
MSESLRTAKLRSFVGQKRSVQDSREFVRTRLASTPMLVDTAELLVSELATNALLHTRSGQPGGAFEVGVVSRRGRVRVWVRDEGRMVPSRPRIDVLARVVSRWRAFSSTTRTAPGPRPRQAGKTDTNGRGLALVKELANRWGVRGSSYGWVVWFELALPCSQRPCPTQIEQPSTRARVA